MAACSRPSTAESVGTITTSGSSLSPPPTSLENVCASAKYLSNKDGPKPDLHFDYNAAQEPAIAIADANADEEDFDPEDHDWIQPYIDPNSEFDYYDQAEGHEEHDVDINDPDIGLKFKYPKLPPVEHFEKYLKNPSEMQYDELYKRAAIVSTVSHRRYLFSPSILSNVTFNFVLYTVWGRRTVLTIPIGCFSCLAKGV